MPPLVIQIFSPLRSQLPSVFFTACVRIRGGIRAGAGLGEAECRNHFAAGEPRQIARLLFRSAEQQNALHADGTVRADGERHRAVVRAALAEHAQRIRRSIGRGRRAPPE